MSSSVTNPRPSTLFPGRRRRPPTALRGGSRSGILGLLAGQHRCKATWIAHPWHHSDRGGLRVGWCPLRRRIGAARCRRCRRCHDRLGAGRLRWRRGTWLRRGLRDEFQVVSGSPSLCAPLLHEPPTVALFVFQLDDIALGQRQFTRLDCREIVQCTVARQTLRGRRWRRRWRWSSRCRRCRCRCRRRRWYCCYTGGGRRRGANLCHRRGQRRS